MHRYSYSERFRISQDRNPYLLNWVEAHTPLVIQEIPDPQEEAWLDRVYCVDKVALHKKTNKLVGLSLRTINVESHIHKTQGYGIHLRTKDLKSGNSREFFKNTNKFSTPNFKEKTGLDYLLVVQGFFKHSQSNAPELQGVIMTESQQLMQQVINGNFLEYVMRKHTSHPALFTFVPFFEILPNLDYVKFQLKDLRGDVCIKSRNTVEWVPDSIL